MLTDFGWMSNSFPLNNGTSLQAAPIINGLRHYSSVPMFTVSPFFRFDLFFYFLFSPIFYCFITLSSYSRFIVLSFFRLVVFSLSFNLFSFYPRFVLTSFSFYVFLSYYGNKIFSLNEILGDY